MSTNRENHERLLSEGAIVLRQVRGQVQESGIYSRRDQKIAEEVVKGLATITVGIMSESKKIGNLMNRFQQVLDEAKRVYDQVWPVACNSRGTEVKPYLADMVISLAEHESGLERLMEINKLKSRNLLPKTIIVSPLTSGPIVVATVLEVMRQKKEKTPKMVVAVVETGWGSGRRVWLPDVSIPGLVVILDDLKSSGGTAKALEMKIEAQWHSEILK